MIHDRDVSHLTTAELDRAIRDLHASLGLIAPGSPAHAPIQAHMSHWVLAAWGAHEFPVRATDAELAGRAGEGLWAR